MVIDALMQQLFGKAFDRGGQVAARGRVLTDVVAEAAAASRTSLLLPPKSCGREEFGAAFVARFSQAVRRSGREADVIATATALTARSMLDAYARFCWPHLGQRAPLAKVRR